ncbi:MAG: hypothetical protein Q9217_002159 [Psora testacea]
MDVVSDAVHFAVLRQMRDVMSQLNGPGASVTPTQQNKFRHGRSMSHQGPADVYDAQIGGYGQDARSLANALVFGPRNASLAPSIPPPGSFSSDLKAANFMRAGTPGTAGTLKTDSGSYVNGDYLANQAVLSSEQKQNQLRDKINKETKIKIGSENLLEALIAKNVKQTKDQRQRVESELSLSNRKLIELNGLLEDEIEKSKLPETPSRDRLSGIFQSSPLKSPSRDEGHPQVTSTEQESESPSYVLDGILQALEIEGMHSDYYVDLANRLVELFKRYPTLKYDLAWSIFGLRVQTMLLSDSREVVAAGYRVTRHAIADRRSLQTIRGLNTDELVILSLIKETRASIEREQALKFVRAFLDVKGGVEELSNAVIRTVVSIAEHHEDRLRNISLLTIAEILLHEPSKIVQAGGISPLADALVEGTYHGSEGLALIFLQLEDKPQSRAYLTSGYELDGAFTPFTDPAMGRGHEERLKSNAQLISAIFKTWPGLFAVARRDFMAAKSLLKSLQYPITMARDLILDLLFDVLHITPPSWTSSFLAGRRLTTYGRVANLKADSTELHFKAELIEEENTSINLVEHFTTLLLAVLMQCGLVQALTDLAQTCDDASLRRKTTLLLGEVLKLADHALPRSASASWQALPELFVEASEAMEAEDDGGLASGMIYQIDRVARTIHRSSAPSKSQQAPPAATTTARQSDAANARLNDPSKSRMSVDMDELRFRSIVLETQVLTTANYLKWRWDLINDLVDGPLTNPKRLEESIKASKFMKRLVGFYRPFKYRFCEVRNTKPNERYVRTGCALMKTLLQTSEGITYLTESKLLRQLAECLAQLDRQSGLTAMKPLFSRERIADTLAGGYFAMLGALSSDPKGLNMLERWRMVNMFYHILDLDGREDLIRVLLSNMDFSLESHLRVMLSKALTACRKNIRIFATRLVRKYATAASTEKGGPSRDTGSSAWAIRLLVTQLYDPEVQVSEVAVQILEEVCNRTTQLEYVVKCRPALDHLGAIGAPLLLRFLSTSLGYKYLDGLDYITQEMDDWFLGRNDSYVTLVEASLSRALSALPERPKSSNDEYIKSQEYGTVPPHFYRELTRTLEGCRLLRDSGHFEAFVATIRDSWAEQVDTEVMLKVKGCLWAVGNVGAMELGAPFLEESDVVTWIVKIASYSQVLTMRGTAFFVLGLISRSLHGMEILAEHGWSAATDHMGRSLGCCLPPSLEVLLSIDDQYTRPPPPVRRHAKPAAHDNPTHARILAIVTDLGNTVLTKKAAGDLYSIKAKAPEQFGSVALFHKVMRVLENYNFRLQVRRFVIDLFDKGIMRRMVLEDDSGNESQEGFTCPFASCGQVHALGDCSQDVTLNKVIERISIEVARSRPLTVDTPMMLDERPHWKNIVDSSKDERVPASRILNGGRLLATYTLAEIGELRYDSEVAYQTMSPTGDTYENLDIAMLNHLKEATKNELDCQVCYALMLDPLTTTCGHTFCRKCVARVLDHSNLCPICRRTLLMPPGVQGVPANQRLAKLLSGLCPDALAARAEAAAQEEGTMFGERNVPFFICTLAYPSMPTFLHVFEPRYRLMTRRAVESGDRKFGMLMYNRCGVAQGELGATQFMQYGTMLHINNMQMMHDGRSILETKGVSRFRVRGWDMLDGYVVGNIERIDDVSLAEEERIEAEETTGPPAAPTDLVGQIDRMSTLELLRIGTDFVTRMRAASAPWLRDHVLSMFGDPPEDPALFPYWFASVLPISDEEKYKLLPATSVRERLKITAKWVRRIEAQRWIETAEALLLQEDEEDDDDDDDVVEGDADDEDLPDTDIDDIEAETDTETTDSQREE